MIYSSSDQMWVWLAAGTLGTEFASGLKSCVWLNAGYNGAFVSSITLNCMSLEGSCILTFEIAYKGLQFKKSGSILLYNCSEHTLRDETTCLIE